MNSYKIEYQSIGGSNLLAKITDYISNHKIVIIILLALLFYFWKTHTIEKFAPGPCRDLNETDCNDASQCEWKLDPIDRINKCFMKTLGGGGEHGDCGAITKKEDCSPPSCQWSSFVNMCLPNVG
jgi:hypothetical protein